MKASIDRCKFFKKKRECGERGQRKGALASERNDSFKGAHIQMFA
jgi:hypothetical protein